MSLGNTLCDLGQAWHEITQEIKKIKKRKLKTTLGEAHTSASVIARASATLQRAMNTYQYEVGCKELVDEQHLGDKRFIAAMKKVKPPAKKVKKP